MTLDRDTLRERLQFYRELGVGPLYRREVSACRASAREVVKMRLSKNRL